MPDMGAGEQGSQCDAKEGAAAVALCRAVCPLGAECKEEADAAPPHGPPADPEARGNRAGRRPCHRRGRSVPGARPPAAAPAPPEGY